MRAYWKHFHALIRTEKNGGDFAASERENRRFLSLSLSGKFSKRDDALPYKVRVVMDNFSKL